MAVIVSVCVVFNLLHITLVKIWRVCNITLRSIVLVADVAIQHSQVGCSPYSTALTTTVGVTCDGRNAVVIIEIGSTIGCRQMIFVYANNDVRLTIDVISIWRNDIIGVVLVFSFLVLSYCWHAIVLSYCTCPSSTIDIAHHATLDVGC